ncbi:tRNA pseudouridine(55) synthase TruB [Eubacteriales bacterium KG127]
METQKNKEAFLKLAEELVNGERFVIFPHKDPDGDALGASIGLANALSAMNKNVIVLVDLDSKGEIDIKAELQFIDKESLFISTDKSWANKETYGIMLDCGELSRIPGREEIFLNCKKTFCIDHHETSKELADYNVICPESSATCQLVWELLCYLKEFDLEITKEMAESLYVGLMTDTGGFRYSNTSRETHLIAAEMFQLGIDHYEISRNIFESEKLTKLKLKSEALNHTEFMCQDKAGITFVTQDMIRKCKADIKDTDGIVEEIRNVNTVEVACLCKEQEDGRIKVSMRAKDTVDVAKICKKYGGGGHIKAAGCTLDLRINEAVILMKNELENSLFPKIDSVDKLTSQEIFGIINAKKVENMTSHDVVAILRRTLGIKKIGHTGTLDPMATGVLPVAVGNATKYIEYLDKDKKSYIAGIKFGMMTDTLDIWGTPISMVEEEKSIRKDVLISALDRFKGKIKQIPPKYSAIKIKGKRLYHYARAQEDVEIPEREVVVYRLELLEGTSGQDDYRLLIQCSRGTYIRSLIRDIGEHIGIPAVMSSLVRIESGNFKIDKSIDILSFKDMKREEAEKFIQPIDQYIVSMREIVIPKEEGRKFQNGGKISLKKIEFQETSLGKKESLNQEKYFVNIYKIYDTDKKFLGTGKIIDNMYLKGEKVIPNK